MVFRQAKTQLKGRLARRPERKLLMNELSCNPKHATRQPRNRYSPSRDNPLRGAMIANSQLKLCLRRLRADTAGSHRIAAITRLLAVGESVERSLSWLTRCGARDESRTASATDHEQHL